MLVVRPARGGQNDRAASCGDRAPPRPTGRARRRPSGSRCGDRLRRSTAADRRVAVRPRRPRCRRPRHRPRRHGRPVPPHRLRRADLQQAGWAGTGRIVRIALWGITNASSSVGATAPRSSPALLTRSRRAGGARRSRPRRLCGAGAARWLARNSPAAPRPAIGPCSQTPTSTNSSHGTSNWTAAVARRAGCRAYLRALASSTAGTPSTERLIDAAGVDRATAAAYDDIFQTLMVTQRVPAYANNRLSRLARRPKRYVTEPSLLAPLAGIDDHAARRAIDLLGRLIDTYVAAQIRPELEARAAAAPAAPPARHQRQARDRPDRRTSRRCAPRHRGQGLCRARPRRRPTPPLAPRPHRRPLRPRHRLPHRPEIVQLRARHLVPPHRRALGLRCSAPRPDPPRQEGLGAERWGCGRRGPRCRGRG